MKFFKKSEISSWCLGRLSGACNSTLTCIDANTVCQDGTCVCQDGYERDADSCKGKHLLCLLGYFC